MFYPRPESPPPRAPSPPLLAFTPLPSPSSRSTRKSSSASSAPCLPPGLHQEKTLLTVRSCEHLSPLKNEFHRQPKRIRSSLGHTSAGVRTQSLPEPFTQPISPRPHQRALSFSSRTSPPPSPSLQSPPPPVPRIPSFILTPADKKSTRSTDSFSSTPIYLPDIESVSPIPELPASILKSSKKTGLGKTRSAGMTCLKFFNLRNSLKSNRL